MLQQKQSFFKKSFLPLDGLYYTFEELAMMGSYCLLELTTRHKEKSG